MMKETALHFFALHEATVLFILIDSLLSNVTSPSSSCDDYA